MDAHINPADEPTSDACPECDGTGIIHGRRCPWCD